MTTVKEFKDLGVEFVAGDERSSSVKGHGDVHMSADMAYGSNHESKTDHEYIKSFAWRPLNTLPDNPEFKYELNVIGLHPRGWRPSLDQSQTETKEEKEVFDKMKPYDFAEHVSSDKPVFTPWSETYSSDKLPKLKPVFTQAMADDKQLPSVGEKVLASVDGEFVECEFLKSRVNGSGMTVYAVMCEGFELLWTGDIKPFDTRTPKQKAVDAACESIEQGGNTIVINIIGALYDNGFIKC